MMNVQSWILLIAVIACFIGAVIYTVKNKGGSCCGKCDKCTKSCQKPKS